MLWIYVLYKVEALRRLLEVFFQCSNEELKNLISSVVKNPSKLHVHTYTNLINLVLVVLSKKTPHFQVK